MSEQKKFSETEEKLVDTILNLANALESVAVDTKQRVSEIVGVKEEKLDFDKLFWEQKQGEKGPFQQTSEKSTGNNDLWKALKAKVKEHNGFWQHAGFKYWFDMQQETVIDRRKIS
jgi:hypothetical protein